MKDNLILEPKLRKKYPVESGPIHHHQSRLAGVRASTVLTNLQRGNIPTMQTTVIEPVTVAGPHQRAGQGELTSAEITDEVRKSKFTYGSSHLF